MAVAVVEGVLGSNIVVACFLSGEYRSGLAEGSLLLLLWETVTGITLDADGCCCVCAFVGSVCHCCCNCVCACNCLAGGSVCHCHCWSCGCCGC